MKLRSIMHMHMDFLLANMQLNLKLSNETQRLRLESQEGIQAARYAYQDFLGNLIEEGIQNGEFRPVNTRLAARSLINLLATAIYTSRPSGSTGEMVDEALSLFLQGVRAEKR